MTLFQPPPTTRYDLNFNLLGFPVRVSPLFWLIAVLFGLSLASLWHILVWVVVLFVSILIHEMGHALAMRAYDEEAEIVLHGFGGLAIPSSSRWGGSGSRTAVEDIIVSLAGPAAGFLLAVLVLLLVFITGGTIEVNWLAFIIPIPNATVSGGPILNITVSLLLWVNIFWGLINLLPVFPLDGGQVSRSLFTISDPWDGQRKSLIVSAVVGGLMAVVGFVFFKSIFMGFLFGILALQSYQMLRGQGGLPF
jgi:Zn-dependent protease